VEDQVLAIAAHVSPDLDPSITLGHLDDLASGFGGDGAAQLCGYLFRVVGFRGDTEHYYDQRNSCLDQVVARRLGIPITLSVVALAVGRRAGVGLVGVGMPGHFLLRDAADPDAFFDPFAAGAGLDRAACREQFGRLHGPSVQFTDSMLDPTAPLQMVERILLNLTRIHLESQDRSSLAWVLRLRSLLPGADPSVLRQFAGVSSTLGRFWESAAAFEQLAVVQPDRADAHLAAAHRLRANSN